MIAVPPRVRILLAAQPVDVRKGMDGLAALVQQVLRADPFQGDVFIFHPKRADRERYAEWCSAWALRTEDEDVALERVGPQRLLHQGRQPIHALAEVDRPGRHQDPHRVVG